jgi:hypothetical protein
MGLQPGSSKTRAGRQYPDHEAQFRHTHDMGRRLLRAKDTTVSFDAKEKELVGSYPGYKNSGRELESEGGPVRVGTHDFPAPVVPKAVP